MVPSILSRKHPIISRIAVIAFGALLLGLAQPGCSGDDNPVKPPPDDTTSTGSGRLPVVFVHGFLEAADAFVPLSQLFVVNGYTDDRMYAFDFEEYLSGSTPDIAKMATQLQNQVASVLQKTGHSHVDIIAHGIGAQAVQRYLATMGGTAKVAHAAFLGGMFDLSIVKDGSLTPGPTRYLTIRSNGNDATQNGDASKGSLTGADNQQINGLDHQQLLASMSSEIDVFSKIRKFFTDKDTTIQALPRSARLRAHVIRGRVISFIDNKPVPNVEVRYYSTDPNNAGRQILASWRRVTTDAAGYYTITDTVNLPLEISVQQTGYHDVHLYPQGWRAGSQFERIKMIPKSGGSGLVQSIQQALAVTQNNAVVLLYSPYRALYNGRNQCSILTEIGEPSSRTVNLINAQTAPAPGGAGSGSNTFMMFLTDSDGNQQDGSGPIPNPALNMFGINSYDVFLDAIRAGLFGSLTMDSNTIQFLNWRSFETTPESKPYNNGITMVRFDYFE